MPSAIGKNKSTFHRKNMNYNIDELKQIFERDGAIVLHGFFGVQEMAAVNRQLDDYAALPESQNASKGFNETFKKHETAALSWTPVEDGVDSFIELRNQPQLHATTAAILGADYLDDISLAMLTGPGAGQAWHQDTASQNPGEYTVNRLIYTRDTSPEAGGIVYVPGSHLTDDIPPGGAQEPISGEALLAPSAGTLVFLHSRCYHRVTVNRTDKSRFSINFRVRPASAPADLTKIAVYRSGKWDFSKNQEVARD
jgi:ectoine hydroxylase-related dioxygenase (phytanoyl-CoA dioxygenase family)